MQNLQYKWESTFEHSSPIRICFTTSPFPLMPHKQDELELMYFYQTRGCFYRCTGKNLSLQNGDLVVVNPHEIHSCGDWGNPCHAVCVIINVKKLPVPLLREISFQNKIKKDADLADIFSNLILLLTENQPSPTLDCLILSWVFQLFPILLNNTQTNRNTDNRLVACLNYIDENFTENIRISQLADLTFLSEDRFYHFFKEQTGFSPSDYILSKRISHATALLSDSKMTITEIALECGFCSPSYFSKKFREYIHITPLEYRRKHQACNTVL